jgi:probable F420-dependent oxidoreductase
VALNGSPSQPSQLAAEIERRGFDAVWLFETHRESIVQATMALSATRRITVGTNVTLAFPRSPVITAMQAWDLNDLFHDRFVLGLGTAVRRVIEDRYAVTFGRPAERMTEYARAMRTVWRMERGERTAFDGDFYRVTRTGPAGLGRASHRPLPPVYVAAVGPLMTKVAAREADGMLGHPFSSLRYLHDTVMPRVEKALVEAGRQRAEFTVAQSWIVSISDDRATAVREAKQQIAFYAITPNYAAVLRSHGDEELAQRLRQVWAQTSGDPNALAAAVPDDAVERYSISGTSAEVHDRLAEFEQHIDHAILSVPWFGVSQAKIAENTSAIIESLAPNGGPPGN